MNVEELICDDDAVAGVRYRTREGASVTERARMVVGADGRNSFVARALALPKYDERPRCTFASWSYDEGVDLGGGNLHRRGRLALAVVPTNVGQNMTLVFGPSEWASHFRRDAPTNVQRAIEYISPQIGEIVREQGHRTERFFGTLDQAAFLPPMYGNGWVLVGDAECFKDQNTAIRMTHAFRDAELAATALHGWLSGQEPIDVALQRYENRRRSQTAAAYDDHVGTLAEMRALRHDELQMFAMLHGNQPQTDLFIAAYGDIVGVSEFFDLHQGFGLDGVCEPAHGRLNGYPWAQGASMTPFQLEASARRAVPLAARCGRCRRRCGCACFPENYFAWASPD